MDNILIATFLTGLTTGGLSCFAVQGGLLSGSLARQADAAMPLKTGKKKPAQPGQPVPVSSKALALSVVLFLLAKLVVYTLLGLGLGWLGSVFYLSPTLKGAIQIAIGIFLLGNGLRMFNVHPIFRYFTFEPPSSITRFIRKASKGNDRLATPLFLGALTILIPCGITQAAMAVAVGTGDPMMGAAIMFAFVLGTSPTFFGVTVLAAGLAKVFQKYFMPIVAVFILGLALVTIDGGLNLIGSPLSSSALWHSLTDVPQQTVTQANPDPSAPLTNLVKIDVQNSGYFPAQSKAPAGQPIQIQLTTNNTQSCSRAFMIPSLGIQELLPPTGQKVLQIPAQKAGTALRFTCSMGMYNGVIQFQ
jgi:sulfite exporter TauE/SafE